MATALLCQRIPRLASGVAVRMAMETDHSQNPGVEPARKTHESIRRIALARSVYYESGALLRVARRARRPFFLERRVDLLVPPEEAVVSNGRGNIANLFSTISITL